MPINLVDVGETIYTSYNQAIVSEVTKKRRPGIHVSDLIEPKCMRMVYYQKKVSLPMSGDTCKVFYRGNIVHEHSNLSTIPEYHELEIGYNPVKDICVDLDEEDKKHPDPKDVFWNTIVIGTPDDIIKHGTGDYIIGDKKTKKTKPETMLFGKKFDSLKEEHRSQLNMYRVMFGRKTGIDAKYGCILSLDAADGFVKPLTQPFELDDPSRTRMNMIKRLEFLVEHLTKNKLPPRYNPVSNQWCCNEYCNFYSWCYDGDGKNV